MPFFIEHQQRYAGDWLGHGVDAENRVELHGFGCFHIHHPKPLKVDQSTAARHHGNHAREFVSVYITLQYRTYAGQPFRRNTYIFWSGGIHTEGHDRSLFC